MRSPDNADELNYVVPLNGEGGSPDAEESGYYDLAQDETYYYALDGADANEVSAHFQWDDDIIITSITVEDCNASESIAPDYSEEPGDWIPESHDDAFVGTTSDEDVSAEAGVVAVAGGTAGGCMFHVGPTGARRTRLAVVVGGTGGLLRCLRWGKA